MKWEGHVSVRGSRQRNVRIGFRRRIIQRPERRGGPDEISLPVRCLTLTLSSMSGNYKGTPEIIQTWHFAALNPEIHVLRRDGDKEREEKKVKWKILLPKCGKWSEYVCGGSGVCVSLQSSLRYRSQKAGYLSQWDKQRRQWIFFLVEYFPWKCLMHSSLTSATPFQCTRHGHFFPNIFRLKTAICPFIKF